MTEIKNDNDKVWVTVSNTINLGQYNSVKIEMGYNETVIEGTAPIAHIETMCMLLKGELKEQSIKFKKEFKRKKRIE